MLFVEQHTTMLIIISQIQDGIWQSLPFPSALISR